MSETNQKESQIFDAIRKFILPIYGREFRKVLPYFITFFFITFIYHILRCLKHTLIIKTGGAGAEVIPFVKLWLVLPSSILFTYVYSKIADSEDRQRVLFKVLGLFVTFFVIFLYFLYPLQEYLQPTKLVNILSQIMPIGCKGLLLSINNWPMTLFYIMSEMWSIMVITVLFWGFLNEVTQLQEAKRFYAIIGVGANLASILSGQLVQTITITEAVNWIPFGTTAWDQSIFLQLNMVLLLTIFFGGYFGKHIGVIDKQIRIEKVKTKKPPTKKIKMNLLESFKFLMKSRYTLYLLLMVISYNIVANIADFIWLQQLDSRFNEATALNIYQGKLDTLTGLISVTVALLFFSNIMRRWGWTVTAAMAPIIWLIMSALLYAGIFYEQYQLAGTAIALINSPFNELIIVLGTWQMSMGKSSKYTFYDQSKEIAYIPLSTSEQRKSKAIIDGIGSRVGKSGGSIILQILLIISAGQLSRAMPVVAGIVFLLLLVWLFMVIKLGKNITRKNYEPEIIKADTITSKVILNTT